MSAGLTDVAAAALRRHVQVAPDDAQLVAEARARLRQALGGVLDDDHPVAEECGEWDECGDYTDAFGDRVIVIEYTAKGLSKACAGFGDELSIVRRDLDVSPKGGSGYVRETC